MNDAAAPAPTAEAAPPTARVLGIVLLSIALHLPCVGWGFFIDDYGHQLVLQGLVEHPTMKPWSLYDFGSRADVEDLREEADALPWWTSSDWSVRFLRPVSSLSLWLDSVLFGGWAPGFHGSGLAWFAGLLGAAYALYRALGLPGNAALWSLLVLAVEDGTVMPVGWPANRNGLLEALLTTLALLVLVRGARRGRTVLLPVALALGTASMLAKESGGSALALIALWLWWTPGEERPALSGRARAVGAACALLLGAAFLTFFVGMGYGAHSTFYPPPWQDPLAFAARLLVLLPAAATALLTPLTSDLLLLFPGATWPGVVVAGLVLVPVGIVIHRVVRSHPAARFLAAWVLVTLLPQASAPLSDRLFLVPLVGAAGLVGLFLHRAPAAARVRGARPLARLVLGSTVVLSALALGVRGLAFRAPIALARRAALEAEVEPGLGRGCEAFLLQSPTELASLQPTAVWRVEGGAEGVRFRPLQGGRRGVRWTRVDERSFELESLDAPFLNGILERVFLSDAKPPAVGQRWATSIFTVEAVAVDAEGLRRFRVRLPRPLESPDYRFLTWRDGRWRRLAPPAVGESVTLRAVVPPLAWLP